jgi:hypothetical protein
VLAIGLAKQPADRFATEALAAALAGQLPASVRQRGLALLQSAAWAESR